MTDQIWVPIAIALFGNTVAVLIVVLTNRAAVRREEARQAHELKHWTREDAWKVGEVQRAYYVSFYSELRKAALAIHDAGYEIGPPLEFGWQFPAFDALENLRVFGSPGALEQAETAYNALYRWGAADRTDYESAEEIEFNTRLDGYLTAVRADIGIVEAGSGNPRSSTPLCPQCGHTLHQSTHDHTARFCPGCGAMVRSTQ